MNKYAFERNFPDYLKAAFAVKFPAYKFALQGEVDLQKGNWVGIMAQYHGANGQKDVSSPGCVDYTGHSATIMFHIFGNRFDPTYKTVQEALLIAIRSNMLHSNHPFEDDFIYYVYDIKPGESSMSEFEDNITMIEVKYTLQFRFKS